jgi:hypothetical protein
MTVHCKACGHQWEIQMRLPISITRFVKVIHGATAAGCPQCGAHGENVLCGPAPLVPHGTPKHDARCTDDACPGCY